MTMRHVTPRRTARGLALVAAVPLLLAGSCTDEAVELEEDFNTRNFRRIDIAFEDRLEGPAAEVRPYRAVRGSSRPPVPGDPPLRIPYWGKTQGSPDVPDGFHTRMVRVGVDTRCDTSLGSIFPNGNADASSPGNYDFASLDAEFEAIRSLNTARPLWQAGLVPGAACVTAGNGRGFRTGPTLDQAGIPPDKWGRVAFHTLQHLRNEGGTWNGRGYDVSDVEFLGDPIRRLGYDPGEVDIVFDAYAAFAQRVKDEWPDENGTATVRLGGISFTLSSAEELEQTPGTRKHPLLRFVDFVADRDDVPLDFLTFRTRTPHPFEVREIAGRLRGYLDDRGMEDTELVVADVAVARDDMEGLRDRGVYFDDDAAGYNPGLESIYLGAFRTAARIYLQDVPVARMIGGRGPRVLEDLSPQSHPAGSEAPTVHSRYFDYEATRCSSEDEREDGSCPCDRDDVPCWPRVKPGFVAAFPFRHIGGQQRVEVPSGEDERGTAVLASHEPGDRSTLHVLIANANVRSGNAGITYGLRIQDIVPASFCRVEYKLAVLDQRSFGLGSFIFSETGIEDTLRAPETSSTRSISFRHTMEVPSVHYIQFQRPEEPRTPGRCVEADATRPAGSDG